MNFVPKYEEDFKKALNEIAVWRRREIDNMIFTDSEEEKWFTEMLMNRPIGIENVDEFEEFMLKCYRKTQKEKK